MRIHKKRTQQRNTSTPERRTDYQTQTPLIRDRVLNSPVERSSSTILFRTSGDPPSRFEQKLPMDAAQENVTNISGSPGERLAPSIRGEMEPKFGHDFSNARVHHDSRADSSSEKMNARAFTVGNQISFAQGQYSPFSLHGKELLAHELVHVVQNNRAQRTQSVAAPMRVRRSTDTSERLATKFATRVSRGQSVQVPENVPLSGIARKESNDDEEAMVSNFLSTIGQSGKMSTEIADAIAIEDTPAQVKGVGGGVLEAISRLSRGQGAVESLEEGQYAESPKEFFQAREGWHSNLQRMLFRREVA